MKINKYWFRPKRFGYGATPTTWEGWLITVGFIGFIAYVASRMPTDNSRFYAIFILSVILFVVFVKKKTDGEWTWNWGKKEVKK